MALPTITSNSPAVGSISWTQFTIQWGGTAYPVGAGSTSLKYVWWKFNAGAPELVGANELPIMGAEDLLLFLNKGGIGVLAPYADVIEGSLIVPESILAGAIGANQINATHIEADAVQAKHLAAGSVTTDALAVGTVSDNLATNGSFEEFDADGYPLGWEVTAMTNGTVGVSAENASSGARALKMGATTTTANLRVRQTDAKVIPVSSASARRWYISVRAGASAATTTGLYVRAEWLDANKALITGTNFADIVANRAVTTTFTVYEGTVAPPAAARFMRLALFWLNPNVVSSLYVDEITAREVIVAAHIGDGQITTPKLVAGSVTAEKMAIGDFTNLAAGGSFDSAVPYSNWNAVTGSSIVTTAGVPYAGPGCLQVAANAAARSFTHKEWPTVSLDEELYYEFYAKTSADWNGTALSRLRFANQANTQVAEKVFTSTPGWTKYSGTVKVPAGMSQLRLEFHFNHTVGTVWIDEALVRRRATGELIVDGTVTGVKLKADAIDGKVITGATLRTLNGGVEWTDAGITAKNVSTSEQTFNLDAATGAVSILKGDLTTVSTSSDDGVTVRATLGTTEVSDYPGQQVSALYFEPSNAAAGDLHASVTTKSGGKELTLSSGMFASNPDAKSSVSARNTGIWLRTSEVNGTISADSAYNITRGDLYIEHQGQEVYNTTSEPGAAAGTYLTTVLQQYRGKISMNATDLVEVVAPSVTLSSDLTVGRHIYADGGQVNSKTLVTGTSNLGYDRDATSWNYVRFANGFPGFYLRNDGTNGVEKAADAAIWAPGGSNNMHLRAPTIGSKGAVRVDSGSFFEYYDPPTSTFSANVGIATTPKDRIYKLTSRRKSKVNIHDFPVEKAAAILKVNPRLWYDRTQVEERLGKSAVTEDTARGPQVPAAVIAKHRGSRKAPEPVLREIAGLVAEEVEAAGLPELVTYADNPETGAPEVEGIAYDRAWTMLIPLVRELWEEHQARLPSA